MTKVPTEQKLVYIGEAPGFAQRTYDARGPTPFLRDLFPEQAMWRSPVNQCLIIDDLKEFRSSSVVRVDDPLFELAVHKTAEMFTLRQKVKAIHLNDVFQLKDLDIWSKSPGLPWRDIGYKTKDDIRKDSDAIRHVRKFAHLIKNGRKIKFPDCLAFVRAHTCEEGEIKVRAVWGYPATVTFIEAMFAVPLLRAYKDQFPDELRPLAYGFETAVGGMRKLCKRFITPDVEKHVALDFKKFDKTVPAWLINIAFDILMYNIDWKEYQDYGVADARKNMLLFNSIRKYFIETTIRTAGGQRFRKRSRIASGSYFTQLVGSIVNAILLNWVSLHQFQCYPRDMIVLGHDSILSSSHTWDFDICADLMKTIGMELNFTKSGQSRSLGELKFLGYTIGNGMPS